MGESNFSDELAKDTNNYEKIDFKFTTPIDDSLKLTASFNAKGEVTLEPAYKFDESLTITPKFDELSSTNMVGGAGVKLEYATADFSVEFDSKLMKAGKLLGDD